MRLGLLLLLSSIPSLASAAPSERFGYRISLSPSYAVLDRTIFGNPGEEDTMTGHGIGGELELAAAWQRGAWRLGPVLRLGHHAVAVEYQQHLEDQPSTGDLGITTAGLGMQVARRFDRFFLRGDLGLVRSSASADGVAFFSYGSSFPRSFGAALELGVVHGLGARMQGQLGLGISASWIRQNEQGDMADYRDRGHLLAFGLKWSVVIAR